MSGSRTRSSSGVDADGADVWKDVNSPLRVKAEMEHANSDDELTDIESIISKIKSLSSTGTDSSNGCSSSDISQRYFEDINDCAEVLEQKFLLNSNKILTARVVKLVNCDYQVGWIADCDVSDCMLCCTSFGWLKRRHHCRSCGLCVCARCSPSKAEVANLVAEEPLSRVCNKCHDFEVRGVISDRGHDDSVKSGFTTKPLTIDEYISMARHSNRSGIQYEVYGSIFEKAQALRCEKSYRMMRGRIPVDVAKVTLKVLLTRDVLPAAVAAHLWSTKALWLIVMHKEDILKLHIADLRGKYAPVGLDLEELCALWHCLPRWDRSVCAQKFEWREGIKVKLDEMLMHEALGTLSESQRRRMCYRESDDRDFCDVNAPLIARFQRAASQIRAGVESPPSAPAAALPEGQQGDVGTSLFDDEDPAVVPTAQPTLASDGYMALAVRTHVPFSCRVSLAQELAQEGDREVMRLLQSARKAPRTPSAKLECRVVEKPALAAKLPAAYSPLPAADKENALNASNDAAVYNMTSLSLSTPSSESAIWDWGSPTSHMKQRRLSGAGAGAGVDTLTTPAVTAATCMAAAETSVSSSASSRASPLSDLDLDNSPLMGSAPSAAPAPTPQMAFCRRGVSTLYFGASTNCMLQGIKGAPAPPAAGPTPAKAYNSSRVPFSGGGSGKSPRQKLTPLPDSIATPDRLTGLLVAAVVSGQAGLVHRYLAEGGYTSLTRAEASNLLLKVVDNPDALQEPFETIAALVDDLKADVNVRDSNGRTPIIALFTDNVLGRFILSRGGDVLAKDLSGSSALSLSMEFGVDWLLEACEATGIEAALLMGGDAAAIKEYCATLLYGGYAAKAQEIMQDRGVVFGPQEMRAVWAVCANNEDNLKEPVETEALCRAYMQ